MRFIFVIIVFFCGWSAFAQDSSSLWIYKYSTPKIVAQAFSKNKLDTLYSISYHLNPFYLRGDFNGDKVIDIAIQISEKKTSKQGIAIIHGGTLNVSIFGAGRNFEYIGDDCNKVNIWSVENPGVFQSHWEKKTLKLKYESVNIGIFECSGGLLYWDGKRYNWYVLTD